MTIRSNHVFFESPLFYHVRVSIGSVAAVEIGLKAEVEFIQVMRTRGLLYMTRSWVNLSAVYMSVAVQVLAVSARVRVGVNARVKFIQDIRIVGATGLLGMTRSRGNKAAVCRNVGVIGTGGLLSLTRSWSNKYAVCRSVTGEVLMARVVFHTGVIVGAVTIRGSGSVAK